MWISDRILWAMTGIVFMLISACAPVYVPSSQQTHLMNKKGELHLATHGGTNGVDLQGAYAVSDHIGVIGAVSYGSEGEEGGSDYHKHKYGEFGISYFKPLGGIGRYEAMAGMGFGATEVVDHYVFLGPDEIKAKGEYNKIFIQNNIGLETGILETGLAFRLGHVTFNRFETTGTIHDKPVRGTFFEPAFFARLGWKNVKIESQVGYSRPFQENVDFTYKALMLTLGVHLQFNTSGN